MERSAKRPENTMMVQICSGSAIVGGSSAANHAEVVTMDGNPKKNAPPPGEAVIRGASLDCTCLHQCLPLYREDVRMSFASKEIRIQSVNNS